MRRHVWTTPSDSRATAGLVLFWVLVVVFIFIVAALAILIPPLVGAITGVATTV